MTRSSEPQEHSPQGTEFAGHVVVFAGKLSSIGRREAGGIVERLGGAVAATVTVRTTMLVVGAEGVSAPERTGKLKRAEAVNARSPGCVRILGEDEFCRLAGLRTAAALAERYHGRRRVRDLYPLVHDARLRYLHTWGLVRPAARTDVDTYYTLADMAVIKQVNDGLRQGHAFRGIVRRQLAARAGQLTLNFNARADARPAKVVALRRRASRKFALRDGQPPWSDSDNPQTVIAARFFLEGAELDEGSEADQERARAAYRKALLLDPALVPAIVNLANIHYAHDELVEAQALYAWALSLDPDCFEAHFNLGNIHHDLGRHEEAVGYYTDALGLNPGYADAHFYLAVTLEKMGRSAESKTHWRAYQQLAPDGEWVDLAKQFSE